nr:tripartite tricarboxylate transporter substrate-binding protein [Variovorax terrae]
MALTDIRRNKVYPQYPTLEEAVPGLGYDSPFGFIGPRGLSDDLAQALSADIVRVLGLPDVREHLVRQAMDVIASTPREFAAVIRRDVAHWRQAVKESGANVS